MNSATRAALALVLLAGCAPHAAGAVASGTSAIATTSVLASLADGVTASSRAVGSLIPVGTSPEDYQPAPQDIARIDAARVLIENGANLEGWLQADLAEAHATGLHVVVCADGLPVRDGNPHLWMDPEYARAYVRKIRDAFVAADPANAPAYRRNAAAYDARLVTLIARTRRKIAQIPPGQRTMIVFHNAFAYYNARFGLRTVGILEDHPGTDPSPQHIASIVTLARSLHVHAVFAEPEYSPKLMSALADSAGIRTVDTLYDDSVGTDPAVADYIGMIDYDTDTIVRALR